MSPKQILNHQSLVSIGLMLTLLGAAFSFGIMYHKVDSLERRMIAMEHKFDKFVLEKRLAKNQINKRKIP